jgi:hypothetical protein
MIIKTETINGIITYTVDKDIPDNKMSTRMNKFVQKKDINHLIDHSCDVYTNDGKLLMRFRKKALTEKNSDKFYNNVVEFAHKTSSNRGSTTGAETKKKNVRDNPHVMSNIFGYFDRWSPSQKFVFKKLNKKPLVDVRETRFNMEFPEKYKKTIPLLKEINKLYKELAPTHYKKQYKKAKETFFRIDNTAFTTVTTNINFQTTVHTDKGDDVEGFGNLVTFQKGDYEGAETCFPQYGIGVDVRERDFLLMDVHEPHGNLPLKIIGNDSERMSIVCYLRKGVWEKTRNKTKKFFEKHRKTMKLMRRVNN